MSSRTRRALCPKESRPMVHTTMRSVAALGSVGLLAVALAACSSSGGAAAPEANELRRREDPQRLHRQQLQYPTEQKAMVRVDSAKFKALTGATVEWETFASANDELTKIQTSVVSGTGPDVYSLGTTFTPTAYGTGAFVKPSTRMDGARGQGEVRAGDAGYLGAGPEEPGRNPVRQPAVRHGLQQGPAEGGRHREAGHHVGRAGATPRSDDQAASTGWPSPTRTASTRGSSLGDVDPGGQPDHRRQDGQAGRPDRRRRRTRPTSAG